MRPVRFLLPLLVAAACVACAEHAVRSIETVPVLPASITAPYRVQIGDVLAIRLFLVPELNEDVTVRPDGRISTQLTEALPAAGMTPEQIAAALRQSYATELKTPRLTVEVKSYAPTRVYVAGEVGAPGELITSGPPPTLLQALSRAGGLRVTGDAHAVIVVRRDAASRPVVFRARYDDAISGRDPQADATLQPYDVVIVPRTDVARLYVWVNQHIQQFVPVSWGFSYNVTPLTR